MFFKDGQADNYDKALHNIYLQRQRTPNMSPAPAIEKLAGGDEELEDRLRDRYSHKYGWYAETPGSRSEGYVYFLKADGFHGALSAIYGRYKIGLSNNPERRLVELNGQQAPCKILMLRAIQVSDMHTVEGELHKKFDANRKHGEWFDFWFWEKPVVNFAYDRYQHNFKVNKLARSRNLKPLGYGALFVGAIAISALFASVISPADVSPATEQKQIESVNPKVSPKAPAKNTHRAYYK